MKFGGQNGAVIGRYRKHSRPPSTVSDVTIGELSFGGIQTIEPTFRDRPMFLLCRQGVRRPGVGICNECGDRCNKLFARANGVGDHGGGPTRRDIKRILDMNAWPIFAQIGFPHRPPVNGTEAPARSFTGTSRPTPSWSASMRRRGTDGSRPPHLRGIGVAGRDCRSARAGNGALVD